MPRYRHLGVRRERATERDISDASLGEPDAIDLEMRGFLKRASDTGHMGPTRKSRVYSQWGSVSDAPNSECQAKRAKRNATARSPNQYPTALPRLRPLGNPPGLAASDNRLSVQFRQAGTGATDLGSRPRPRKLAMAGRIWRWSRANPSYTKNVNNESIAMCGNHLWIEAGLIGTLRGAARLASSFSSAAI